MTHADIIKDLGGTDAVARVLACHPSRVRRWRTAKIPSSRWPEIVAMARDLGCPEVTWDALAAGATDATPVPPLRRGPKPRVVVS